LLLEKSTVVTLTREQLYTLVWSEPIQRIAPKYGISDLGLGKNLRTPQHPRPAARLVGLQSGRERVRQEPLPLVWIALGPIFGGRSQHAGIPSGRNPVGIPSLTRNRSSFTLWAIPSFISTPQQTDGNRWRAGRVP
jgi:hypothetical protein